MPIYEFYCKNCGVHFEEMATVKEKEEGKIKQCTKCGSENIHQVYGGFAIMGGRSVNVKSRDSQNPDGCCGGNSECCS